MAKFDQKLAYSSWLEISTSAFEDNIRTFRNISKKTFKIGVVLKGNAYGHGLEQVFPMVHSRVDCIYVITPSDAFLIRSIEKRRGFRPTRIIVIGGITLQEAVRCSKEKIEVVISGPEWNAYLPNLKKNKTSLKVHLHLDTGLSREGFGEEMLTEQISFLKDGASVLKVVGLMSHFANTEDVTEQNYAQLQLTHFKSLGAIVKWYLNLSSVEEHIGASAATLVLPEARMSTGRIGISLYGLWPSTEARISAKITLGDLPQLKPALAWKSKSQIIKSIKNGSYIGYGCTYRCNQDTRIAVLPVGYFDGYPRIASGKAHVLVNQKRCPIVGRIMMNHMIIDVTHATEDDSRIQATLIGTDGPESISAELVATWAQTINYEIVTRIGSHLPRIVVD